MIPPSSFVSSVYCARPPRAATTSFESSALEELARLRPFDLDLAHVRDVEDAGIRPHGPVLGDHALVLDRHLPAGERNDPRARRDVPLVQRRPAEGLHAAMLTRLEPPAVGWPGTRRGPSDAPLGPRTKRSPGGRAGAS